MMVFVAGKNGQSSGTDEPEAKFVHRPRREISFRNGRCIRSFCPNCSQANVERVVSIRPSNRSVHPKEDVANTGQLPPRGA